MIIYMYELILPSLVLAIRSYMMKALTDDYDSIQYLFIYSVMLMLCTWFMIFKRNEPYTSFAFLNQLQGSHLLIIMLSVAVTVYMATLSFTLIRNNNVVKSKAIIRGLNLVFLAIIGRFYFKEDINKKKVIGLGTIITGIIIMMW